MGEIIKRTINGTEWTIELPDRETVCTLRDKHHLLNGENPAFVSTYKKKPPTGAEMAKYERRSAELNQLIFSKCNVAGMDMESWSMVTEKIGRAVRDYIIQGPQESRPVSIADLERLIGQLLLSEGDADEKTEEVLKVAETIREQLSAAVPEQKIAEADLNADPTQTEI